MVVDWGVSLSELDGVDAECEGAFEEESSSSCCLLSLFLSRRFLDFDDCTRFPLLSDSPATDTRFWTWLLLVSGGTPASSAARPFPPAGPPAPPRAAVARRRGIFPESDLEKQNQTLGWIWSTLLAGFHSILDFKASHRSVPSKVMVSKFAPTSLRNSR